MKKLLLLLSVLLLLSACSSSDSSKLIVGMELAYPPFETKDDAGNPSGISVDLAKALGEYLGREVVIENINWDGLIPSLQTKKVDVVISSMTITEARKENVDFSVPYANSYLAVLTNKASGLQNADELNNSNVTVVVKKGTTGHVFAQNNLANATVNALSSENACVTEVVQGKADAFIYDTLTIYRQHQANPDTTSALFIPFQEKESWGMAVKKGNTQLLEKINQFIPEFISNGGFDELTQKYLAEEKKTFDEYGFLWFFEGVN